MSSVLNAFLRADSRGSVTARFSPTGG